MMTIARAGGDAQTEARAADARAPHTHVNCYTPAICDFIRSLHLGYATCSVLNQNEKNKVSSTLLSLRLDAQPTVTY
eukprot:COSAG02_NODE_14196_length_1298_cov_2.730609_2_plen_77_part_00